MTCIYCKLDGRIVVFLPTETLESARLPEVSILMHGVLLRNLSYSFKTGGLRPLVVPDQLVEALSVGYSVLPY